MLDPIHHQGLRLALGAFRTSPVNSLYIEANEPSLNLRREKLSLQFITKLKSNPSNPAFYSVFNTNTKSLYDKKPKAILPFGLRHLSKFDDLNIDLDQIALYKVPETPPWEMKTPTVLYDLITTKKSDTSQAVFHNKFCEVKDRYFYFHHIFTDGSKAGDAVAAAAVYNDNELTSRLPDKCSIFSAELRAIDLALDHIENSEHQHFIIFSDSLSSLQALENQKLENPTILHILDRADFNVKNQT